MVRFFLSHDVLHGARIPNETEDFRGEHVGLPNHRRVQSLRPPDATTSTQQGSHAAAMRAVATITAETYLSNLALDLQLIMTVESQNISSRNAGQQLLGNYDDQSFNK